MFLLRPSIQTVYLRVVWTISSTLLTAQGQRVRDGRCDVIGTCLYKRGAHSLQGEFSPLVFICPENKSRSTCLALIHLLLNIDFQILSWPTIEDLQNLLM